LKKLSALLIVLALIFTTGSSYTQPQFTIHLKGGYNIPLPDLKGDITNIADSGTYGISQGYGFGADGKYYLGKKRNVGITLDLMYNMFSSGKEDSVFFGFRDFESKLTAFTVGLGIEYAFMPKGKANPFIGAEFTGHFFSGKTEGTFNGVASSSDLKSASRFGIGLGAGVDIAFSKSVGMVIGGKYHMANLIGKEYDTTGIGTNEYQLADKEHTANGVTVDAKNISYIQAYLGISFYLNQPKKKTTKK